MLIVTQKKAYYCTTCYRTGDQSLGSRITKALWTDCHPTLPSVFPSNHPSAGPFGMAPGQLLELFCCSGNQTHRKGTAPTKNPRFLRSHTPVPSVEARKSSSHRLSLTKHGPRLFCPGVGGRGRADARERRSADATARWSGARARARQARRSAYALARPRAWAPARSADRES